MHSFTSILEQYGLAVVFAAVLVEGLGIPFPAYSILIVAAAAAVSGEVHYSLAGLLAVGIAAQLMADAVWYLAAKRFGAAILGLLCRISLSPDSCVQKTSKAFTKAGAASLVFSKFLPGISSIGVVLAGALRTPLPPVIAFNTLGTVLYIGLAVALGALFHDAVEDVIAALARYGAGGLMLLAAVFGSYLLWRWWQRKMFLREIAMNRISVEELYAMVRDGTPPLILDVRPNALRALEGVIPGSIIAHDDDLKIIAQRYPAHTDVVIYCSCPNEASAALMARKLKNAGFGHIHPLRGGIAAWSAAGYAVESFQAEIPDVSEAQAA